MPSSPHAHSQRLAPFANLGAAIHKIIDAQTSSQEVTIMPGTLQGKIALVTGGGSGIGRATALILVREGAKVMIADYNSDGGERTVKTIKDSGGDASFVGADVSIARDVEGMVAETIKRYGRIDCAFNNAGIEG